MKLFARISAAVCAAVAATACGGFDAGERRIINGGEGEIMRVLTTADRDDSLTLRRISAPLDEKAVASDDFAVLRRRMLATVRNPQNEGVGIAAPQVGVSRRLIAVQRFDKAGEPFEFYINPEILSVSGEAEEGPEGCLSVDGVRGTVARPRRIELRYRNERFADTTETVEGFTAVIFQHETDHLDGVLFIDRMERAEN